MDQINPNPHNNKDLSLLAERLKWIKEQSNQFPAVKPRRMTIPAIFKRETDENFISDYLAYILDPNRNGIGTEPLLALLDLAFENIDEIDLEEMDIEREYTFDYPSLGRIDFLICLGENGENGVIGIENKIYSLESENQTINYARAIKDNFPNCHNLYFIFLTPTGQLPTSKEFKAVSYADLTRELRAIHYPLLNDIHKSVIWEDFLAHMEEYIVMNKGKLELSGKTRLYLDHREVLEDLLSAFDRDSQDVYDYVISSIKKFFGESWTFACLKQNKYQEIDRADKVWHLEKFYVFFQYRFSRKTILTLDQFPFMLGAYPGKFAGNFIEWLKANYPQIEEICKASDMAAFSKERDESNSMLIAYKIFPLKQEDVAQLAQQFVDAAKEFSVFIAIMDEAVAAYRKSIGIAR